MNRYCRRAVVLLVNLFLVSSALGQVRLPPEEIGFINKRVVDELTSISSDGKSRNIDIQFVQNQLKQDPEERCSRIEEFKDATLTTKAILEGRLSRSRNVSQSVAVENLICGIEEFVLYDASHENTLVRRTLNRARQLVLNISGNVDTNPGIGNFLKIRILMLAYDIALKDYRQGEPEAEKYRQNGLNFLRLVREVLANAPTTEGEIVLLENGMTWLASDLAMLMDRSAATSALDLLEAVSDRNHPPNERLAQLKKITRAF